MKLQPKNKKELLKAALGKIPSDLVITNANMLNVITGELYKANIFVYDGYIAHVEAEDFENGVKEAKQVFDAKGNYVIPGLIDAHIHIESSMLTPRNFAKAASLQGTTTVITDPHEMANVFGVKGVRYMHDSAEGLPVRELIDIPSCVPSVPDLEVAGATFMAEQIAELADLERVVGLAEVMDFLGVIEGDDRMMDIIRVAQERGLYIQGHAPFLSGRALSAYVIGGPKTCHESRTGKEGIDKLRAGMYLDARDSSISKNVKDIWEGVKHIRYFDHFCLCTDDRESDDILNVGHLNEVVRVAIRAGMHPIDAIRSATYNTAREIRLENLGAIAPGYVADILVVESLEELKPLAVFLEGKQTVENGKLLEAVEDKSYSIEAINSMYVKPLNITDFTIKAPISEGTVLCNVMEFDTLEGAATKITQLDIPVKNGTYDLSGTDLKFVAVVNRHQGSDNIALHIVKNFGITHGALASTVSHDSHNLTIVYDTPENALLAANELIKVGGGMCAVENNSIIHTLALPVGGLISTKEAKELAEDAALMKEANRKLGLTAMENPLLRIVTLALIVIPEVKMSDIGLVNVLTKEFVPLVA